MSSGQTFEKRSLKRMNSQSCALGCSGNDCARQQGHPWDSKIVVGDSDTSEVGGGSPALGVDIIDVALSGGGVSPGATSIISTPGAGIKN